MIVLITRTPAVAARHATIRPAWRLYQGGRAGLAGGGEKSNSVICLNLSRSKKKPAATSAAAAQRVQLHAAASSSRSPSRSPTDSSATLAASMSCSEWMQRMNAAICRPSTTSSVSRDWSDSSRGSDARIPVTSLSVFASGFFTFFREWIGLHRVCLPYRRGGNQQSWRTSCFVDVTLERTPTGVPDRD